LSRKSLLLVALFILFFILGAIVFTRVESGANGAVRNLWDALWWLIVTVSTVGYGDVVPKTPMGRLVGGVVIVAGAVSFTLFTGYVASYLVDWRLRRRERREKVSRKGHVVILGRNGRVEGILRGLSNMAGGGVVVLVGDYSPDQIDELARIFPNLDLELVAGDFHSEPVIEKARVDRASRVLVLHPDELSPGDAERMVLHAVLAVRSISDEVYVCAEATSKEGAVSLVRAGANEVVLRDELITFLLSGSAVYKGVCQFFRLAASVDEPRLKVVPAPVEVVGKSFSEALLFFAERRRELGIPVALVRVRKGVELKELLTGDEAIDAIIEEALKGVELSSGREEVEVVVNPDDSEPLGERDMVLVVR